MGECTAWLMIVGSSIVGADLSVSSLCRSNHSAQPRSESISARAARVVPMMYLNTGRASSSASRESDSIFAVDRPMRIKSPHQ